MYDPVLGRAQAEEALMENVVAEDFVRNLGWHGFLWVIRERLDTIYPAPGFRVEQYGVNWASDHGGADIDPGARWATLLDLALKQLEG